MEAKLKLLKEMGHIEDDKLTAKGQFAKAVYGYELLLAEFYEYGETVVDRVIDVHIGKLRQKIEKNPAQPEYILTVRGFGYRFVEARTPHKQ